MTNEYPRPECGSKPHRDPGRPSRSGSSSVGRSEREEDPVRVSCPLLLDLSQEFFPTPTHVSDFDSVHPGERTN